MKELVFVYFITGASGVGKTTVVNALEKQYDKSSQIVFIHMDSLPIPSTDEMIQEAGTPENWQRLRTEEWVDIILSEYVGFDTILFEGQSDPDFIETAFSKHGFTNYEIILFDCNEDALGIRLRKRGQEELNTEQMRQWLRFLRDKAKQKKLRIIDTTRMTEKEIATAFEGIVTNCKS
jgi:broad-specificity NMP kinase